MPSALPDALLHPLHRVQTEGARADRGGSNAVCQPGLQTGINFRDQHVDLTGRHGYYQQHLSTSVCGRRLRQVAGRRWHSLHRYTTLAVAVAAGWTQQARHRAARQHLAGLADLLPDLGQGSASKQVFIMCSLNILHLVQDVSSRHCMSSQSCSCSCAMKPGFCPAARRKDRTRARPRPAENQYCSRNILTVNFVSDDEEEFCSN